MSAELFKNNAAMACLEGLAAMGVTAENAAEIFRAFEADKTELLRAYEFRKNAYSSVPRRARPRPTGFVYLMRNERNGLVKIGFSTDPDYREKTLQSEEPEVRLLASWPGTIQVERELHGLFHSQRVRGEWFKLSLADIAGIMEAYS